MIFNAQLEKHFRKEALHKQYKEHGWSGDLTDVDELYGPPNNEINFEHFSAATDSGAHSIYKEFFVKGGKITSQARANADYSYIKTPEFKEFLDNYIAYLHQYKHLYDFYVTLDIINNPEESWRITEYMESCGLNPMPVFHNGEHIKWLEKMVEKYDYIGISGLGQDLVKANFKQYGDSCFKVICDKQGVPKCKVHGFAVGAPEIIKMYPWYSTDQSTWTYMARVGSLLVPKPIHKGKELTSFDYLANYKVIPVTPRRDVEAMHIGNLHGFTEYFVEEYLRQNDINKEAILNSYHWRDVANMRLFRHIENTAKSWYAERFDYGIGGNIYFAGTPSGAGSNKDRLIKLMHDLKVPKCRFLTTPVYQKHATNVRELVEARNAGIDWRSIWNAESASKSRKMNFTGTLGKAKTPEAPVKPAVVRKTFPVRKHKVDCTFTITVQQTIECLNEKALQELINKMLDQYRESLGMIVEQNNTHVTESKTEISVDFTVNKC